MSHPRMAVPGGTYLITHTTVMSLFLLVPGPVVNQILEYCLAWAARGRGIVIHAISVESNHYHLLLTDLEGPARSASTTFARNHDSHRPISGHGDGDRHQGPAVQAAAGGVR